ncbi:pep-cterm sorting domain-containing protein [Anaeramoeba flamelloides]|uniref:Pep-cterm sorting domain-containing protein n=1 Tax=Anaeramoeba flamelloides TaxID=1746091 RepID=A0AAV7ZEH5_9EUKA|nr:pep-cterm sorting domain-containing protein [Anaeramoeba flamelloides]
MLPKSFSVPIHKKYLQQINNPNFCDVLFLVGVPEETIYAHQFFVSLSSKLFREIFYPLGSDKAPTIVELQIRGVDPISFFQIIKFCYTGVITLSHNNIYDILQLACQLQMPKLIQVCSNYRVDNKIYGDPPIPFLFSGSATTTGNGQRSQRNKAEQAPLPIHYSCPELKYSIKEKPNPQPKTIKRTQTKTETNNRTNETNKPLQKGQVAKQENPENPEIPKEQITNKSPDSGSINEKNTHHQLLTRSIVRRKFPTKKPKKINVAMITADEDFQYVHNVCKSLLTSKCIEKIKIFKSYKRSYSFKKLQSYDAIFLYSSDQTFYKPEKLGDQLAQFVEDGGGLVVCAINCLDSDDEKQIYGRILSPKYLPFGKHSSITQQPSQLGTIVDTQHPIMKDVKKFNGGKNSFRIKTKEVNRDSFIIAKWDDDNILIAEKSFTKNPEFGRVIILNLWPPNNKIDGSCWDSTLDGQKILANSVEYAAGCI